MKLREQIHRFREALAEERDARRRPDTVIAQLTQADSRPRAARAGARGSAGAARRLTECRGGVGGPARGVGTQEGAGPWSWRRRVFGP